MFHRLTYQTSHPPMITTSNHFSHLITTPRLTVISGLWIILYQESIIEIWMLIIIIRINNKGFSMDLRIFWLINIKTSHLWIKSKTVGNKVEIREKTKKLGITVNNRSRDFQGKWSRMKPLPKYMECKVRKVVNRETGIWSNMIRKISLTLPKIL